MDNNAKSPLFSVVTVCYNSGELIRKTIESVLAQDFNDYEYIIQDGSSTDNTLDIAREYTQDFSEKGISFKIFSGKDSGIYDAMNKGTANSCGCYVIFMNADDCFYSERVLADVNLSIGNTRPDIIYGDCIVKELGMYFKFRKCYDLIEDRMPFSHQACFAKRELLTSNPLNIEYKITADYAFILSSHYEGRSFYDSDVCIALVTADGLSSVHMYDTFIEVNKVCADLGHKRYSDSEYSKKIKEMKLKQFVLSYFPDFIKLAIRKRQIVKRGQTTEVSIPDWCKK